MSITFSLIILIYNYQIILFILFICNLDGNIWNAPLKKLFTKKSNKVNQTEQIFCKHLISVFIVPVIILLHGVKKRITQSSALELERNTYNSS